MDKFNEIQPSSSDFASLAEDESNSITSRNHEDLKEIELIEDQKTYNGLHTQHNKQNEVDLGAKRRPTPDPEKANLTTTSSVTDWDGPNDPENPRNWSTARRFYHMIVVGLFGFAVTFSSSVYTPAVPKVMEEFGVSRTVALLPLSVFVIGLAFGPVLSAPISETYGRAVVYRLSIPLFMLFTLGAGFSHNLNSLLACRFLAGFMGSACLAVGAGTNADLFPPSHRAQSSSIFLMSAFSGPSLGPFIGGFVVEHKNWPWTQWTILFFAFVFYCISLPTKETYKKIILLRRAKRLNISPPPGSVPHGTAAIRLFLTTSLIRPLIMLVKEPIVLFLSMYTAFTFGVLFAFFAAFPYVFHGPPYYFSTSQTGLTFLSIGLGVVLGVIIANTTDQLLYKKETRKAIAEGKAMAAPEHRLYTAMTGSVAIPISLFWFAWTADKGVHWASPVVAAIPFAYGNISIFISAALYMVDVYGPLNGASAMGANGILRYVFGAVFPLFTVQMYESLGIGWATSLLGFISLLMLPIPWVLFRWGPKIRANGHYETIT